MLGLTLREEFQGRRLKGTAIELANANHTGAMQVSAADFLRITYPSGDVLKAIEAAGPGQGRPVVLIGERGQGKTHLMGVLYHAFTGASAARSWLKEWGARLGNSKVSDLPLREGLHVITESLHRQSYRFLWDLVFERHPHGSYMRGKWAGRGDQHTDVPGYEGLVPEEIGVSVEGDGPRAVVSWWMIEARGRNGEHRAHVQPLAVDSEGKRIVPLEHDGDQIFRRPVAHPVLRYADRVRLLREHIEPMLQRHLHHRGLVPENGGYSASLIGWVEVGPAA